MSVDIDALQAALAEAATVFEENKQLGAMVVLEAFTKLVEESHPKPLAVLKPIDWMMNEFMRQEFTEPGKPQFDAVRMGMAAGAIDLLHYDKMTVAEAARLVARQCHLGTAEQLIEFRKNIGKGRSKTIAGDAKLQFVNDLKALLADTPKKELRQKAILKAVRALSYR